MGVVYYANYLRWFETGRSEFLRQIGLPYMKIEQEGFRFPVTEAICRYSQSARYDDLITIETELSRLGRATLEFHYRILRESDNALIATGMTKHACTDRTGRVSRLPTLLEEVLELAQAKHT
jgi:acyl-CoA thioester hydrolase